MELNAHFWIHQFRGDFIPATQRVVEVFVDRLVPTFQSIEEEAEKKSEAVYEVLFSQPGDENTDLANLAETAREIGIDYYISMKGLEQGILNTCAVFLYHLFEQQLMIFHRRELLHPHEEKNSKLFTHAEIKTRLTEHGIDIEAFDCWRKIEELRLLSNTIKHGEGKASRDLFQLAPELFQSPYRQGAWGRLRSLAHIGDDLYPSTGRRNIRHCGAPTFLRRGSHLFLE